MFQDITNDVDLCTEAVRQTHSFWGKAFTIDQFHAYADALGAILSQNKCKTHVFGDVINGELVASLEVLERPLYLGHGKFATDYAVASVFVPEHQRRKGYAEGLVSKVAAKFAKPGCQVSLWSDVGDYYKRSGFVLADPAAQTVVIPPTQVCDAAALGTFLTRDDMPRIVQAHREQVMRYADSHEGGVTVPEDYMYTLLQQRAIIEQQLLGDSVATYFGARVGSGWMSWAYLLGYKKVIIMGTEGSAEEIAKMLIMAAEAGSGFGLRVEMFETDLLGVSLQDVFEALKRHHIDCELKKRGHELPMVITGSKWLVPGGYAWY